jgi:hypothetical protein
MGFRSCAAIIVLVIRIEDGSTLPVRQKLFFSGQCWRIVMERYWALRVGRFHVGGPAIAPALRLVGTTAWNKISVDRYMLAFHSRA